MFVKQIDIVTALELEAKGKDIKVLIPCTAETNEWCDYQTSTLAKVLDGCLFFLQEPAMENPDFAKAVEEMTGAGQKSDTAPPLQTDTPSDVDTGPKRRKVDTGKLLALRNAGWSMKKIAEELKVSEGTVWNYLKKMEEEKSMRKIRLYQAPHIELKISVTEEMEKDFRECVRLAEVDGDDGKDCDTCSWNGVRMGDIYMCELKEMEQLLEEKKW